jgi:hypothetical protein
VSVSRGLSIMASAGPTSPGLTSAVRHRRVMERACVEMMWSDRLAPNHIYPFRKVSTFASSNLERWYLEELKRKQTRAVFDGKFPVLRFHGRVSAGRLPIFLA